MTHNRLMRGGIASVLTMILACSTDVRESDDADELESPTNVVRSALSPAIGSVSVSTGIAGTTVTITGSSFGATRGTGNVYFRGNAAPITSWSATQIVCTVPPSTTAGAMNLWVRVNGVDTPSTTFTVVPSISMASPTVVSPGDQVSIDGANFGTTQQPGAKVTIGGVQATINSWSMRKIIATVPAGVSASLAVVVTVNAQASAAAMVTTETSIAPPVGSHVAGREVLYTWMDQGTLADADQILTDVWPTERFAAVTLGSALTWTENPYNDSYWRMQFYSLRPLRNLLFAYRTTGNAVYLTKLLDVVRSFYQSGQTSAYAQDRYTAAMRGLFLVDVYWKLKVADVLPGADEPMFLALLDTTGKFLANAANYDADNSNGLTESAALLTIGANFPTFSDAASWPATAQSRLVSYMSSAIDGSGIVRERSPHQQFQLLSQAWEIARWAKIHAPSTGDALSTSISLMATPAAHLMQPDGRIPLAGASPARTVRGNSIFDEIAQSNPAFNWSMSRGASGTKPNKVLDLPSTGWSIMRSSWNSANFDNQTQIFFDWRRTSHATSDRDLLNVLVYSEGRPLIVDSGMYSNEGTSQWGSYFRSTAAHNTVVVDGQSQMAGVGTDGGIVSDLRFASDDGREPWSRTAHHSAYPGVVHTRAVGIIDQNIIVVLDHLKSATSHTYEQVWHLTPEATQVSANGSAVVGQAADGTGLVRIKTLHSTPDQYDLVPQVTAARDGWISETNGSMQSNYTVRYTAQGSEVVFATLITAGARIADAISDVRAFSWNFEGQWGRGAEVDVDIRGDGIGLYRYLGVYYPGESQEYSDFVDDYVP